MVEQPVRESWIATCGARIVGPGFFQAKFFEIGRWERAADACATGIAISLPWSTTLTWVFIGLWLITLVPTLEAPGLRRVLATPAGGLPVLLWFLALIGMLWAIGVPMAERWGGLSSVFKLLVIPLLMFQFQRSSRASWVMIGFLMSCGALLILSWTLILVVRSPEFWSLHGGFGVPVRDYIAQTGEFAACIFFLAGIALKDWQQHRRWLALALGLAALVFLANLFVIFTSRTGLIVIPILFLLFIWRHVDRRQLAGMLLATVALGAAMWLLVPHIRSSVTDIVKEVHNFRPEGPSTRAGERLEFWRKSIAFVIDAPILGHGTGSIPDQFRRSASGLTGMAALASKNPHSQIFGVAIQLGLVGTAVLFAMWLAHLSLFRGEGLVAWAGLVVVAENVLSSLFNSHLFDFTQGWGYVLGVGVAAGAVLRRVSQHPTEKAQSTTF